MYNEVSTLSSQLQQATQSLEASQNKVSSLQAAYDKVAVRLEEGTREKLELRQRLVEQEGAFASEMSTQQRLNNLMEQAKESAETRMAEVEEQWEAILEQHREKEDALRSEIFEGKQLHEDVEREKQELQMALDRLAESIGIETNNNGDMMSNDGVEISMRSSTPNRSFMSLSGAPTLMSPTAALASRVQKSGKSFTQVYAELARTQEELRRERLESHRIGGVLEQVMADLQERGPALVAQREECEQMSQDLQEMSATLAKACEERDACEREAKMKRLQSDASLRENRILNQQVADLGRQVRDLTREILLRDDPSAAARLEDDGSQVGPGDLASTSDTQMVISTELVTFRSLTELVTQNGRLLRVVRELGTKMEAEEQEYRVKLQQGENEAVAEARDLLSRLQDELRAEKTRLEGIKRERDMFRSMCAGGSGRNQVQVPSASGGVETNAAHLALTNQYSQLQSQFDVFRVETAKDTDRLKEEAYQARAEASKNALDAAKEKATRESIEERLMNAQQTHQMAKKELNELQRRFSSLQETLTKQEIASHSLSQEMTLARSREERLRNEVTNLSAEKRLHQQTAERLMEEKKSNTLEKANLSELLRNVQSMQAELERSSAEARRRLEAHSERLEEQCKEMRSRLAREEEGHRQTAMRREVETTDLKTRLDKANEELFKAREELAVATNSVEYLTTKSEELQRQVNFKEEKLAVYERRTLGGAINDDTTASGSIDREHQLQMEIADLKGELRGAQTDAEQARGHVEQFKAIAAANEEALTQLQAAYDQYRSTTDAAVAERTLELNSLRERIEVMGTELTSAQQEASTLRSEMEAQTSAWHMEKRTLEDAMTELGGVEDRARLAQSSAQEEVRRQVKLTQEAHGKYEAELVAHADDVKTMLAIKEELEAVRSQANEATRLMETAQSNLASSTDSWEAQKVIYEREHEEVNRVIVELRGQNEALHQHLEALQSQTNEMRQATNASTAEIGDSSFSQSGNEELHDVIKYLRREKKIVDLQVEVREQECARLRQSVEHMQRSLDETRMQLSKEREQGAGVSVTAKQHEELMEKINQLSILRESNTTLRDETERSLRKVQSLESQVEALTNELLPLREELRVKRVELEASENQLRLSQEDNKRWQGRTQNILQQYNRIDPEDLKKLQEKKEEAEREVEEQKRMLQIKVEEVEAARTEVQNKQGQFDRLRAQSIDRLKLVNEDKRKLTVEIEQLRANAQSTSHQTELTGLQTELESVQSEKRQLEAQVEALEAEKRDLTSRVAELEAQDKNVDEEQHGKGGSSSQEAIREAVEEAQRAWNEEKQSMEEKRQAIERREQMHLQKAKEFSAQRRAAEKERDDLKTQMAELEQSQVSATNQTSVEGGEEGDVVNQLRQRIAELESELEQANARLATLEVGTAGAAPDIAATLHEQHQTALKEQESRLSSLFTQQQKTAVEIAVNKAKAAAISEATASAGSSAEEIQAAVEAKEKELKAAFEEQLKARYEAGKEESSLRNKLMLKSKDNKIEKLTNELNVLKGITGPIVPTGPASEATAPVPVAPMTGAQRPLPLRPVAATAPRPVVSPIANAPAGRGGGPARGTGRPQGNVQKRKLEGGQTTSPASAAANTAASNGATEGGGLPKRPRPAGAQINIRGGANNRGGRGGH